MKYIFIILCLIILNNGYSQCKLNTTKVTVFKDATAFIEKEGACDAKDGTIEMNLSYNSGLNTQNNLAFNDSNNYANNNFVFGTIEVETPDNKILSKQSTFLIKNDTPLSSISQILQNNIGKEIELDLTDDDRKIRGNIFSVEYTANRLSTIQNTKVNTMTLKQGDSWKFVNLSEIDRFKFIDEPKLFRESRERQLLIHVEKDKRDQAVKMSYLRKGITWTPSYFISINSKDQLKISLNANVLNDVEDFSNIDLNLAVGIPVFKYANIGAPLISNDKIIDLINKINNPNSNSGGRNNILSQSAIAFSNVPVQEVYGNNPSPVIEGDDDDIFLYNIEDVDMKIGDRLNFNITEFETTFEDIYTIDLESNDNFTSSSRNKKKDAPNVWHSIKFKNNADVPLTTGSVFFKKYKTLTQSFMPISQEKLDYTPVGETCIVKMAISPNIIVKQSEREISRQKDTIRQNGYYGYLVKVKGEIELINLKNEAINMMVDRNIKAIKLLESSEEWKIMKTYRTISAKNQSNLIQWNFEVQANGKKTITYEYEIHVNN